MGLFDDVKGWFRRSSEDASKKAATAAAKATAKQTAAAARKAVEEAGDNFLGAAEKELAAAEKAREGRVDIRPDSSSADAIAASIEGAARTAEDSASAASSGSAADDREAKAAAELERLKAQLRSEREAYDESQD